MHQEHAVPWKTASSHFKFFHENPHVTPRRTGFFALNKPRQAQDLNHFARVLAHRIKTFAQTERAKYPAPEALDFPSTGHLFSDALRDQHPEFLDFDTQSVESWINLDQHENRASDHFAKTVKILLSEGRLDIPLMLANHPQIAFAGLCTFSDHYTSGFSALGYRALLAYIFFNFVAAAGMLEKGGREEWTNGFASFFIFTSPVPSNTDTTLAVEEVPNEVEFGHFTIVNSSEGTLGLNQNVNRDFEQYHGYVKELFRVLYQCDTLMRECGQDPLWEQEIIYTLAQITHGSKVDSQWSPDSERWTVRFS